MLVLSWCMLLGWAVASVTAKSLRKVETFEWALVNTSVELAAISYCDDPRGSLPIGGTGIQGFQISNLILGTRGLIGTLPSMETIFVSYAGSGDYLDWVEDADANLVKYKGCDGCKVHQGFNFVEQIGFPLMLYAVGVLKLFHPQYHVVVTGHSKGAGMATIAAIDLIQAGVKDVSLVTFGSPRVGNAAFAEYAARKLSRHYRVTHHTDAIPSLPPRKEGYLHLAGEWYEHPAMQVRLCVGSEDPSCSAQWSKILHLDERRHHPFEVTDHDTADSLREKLEELLVELMGPVQKSEWDHLHYLSRHMRCPSPVDASHNRTDRRDRRDGAAAVTLNFTGIDEVGGLLLRGANAADLAGYRTRDVGAAVNEQRRAMAFAAWGMALALVLVLFLATVARYASASASETPSCADSTVTEHAATEMTPLISSGLGANTAAGSASSAGSPSPRAGQYASTAPKTELRAWSAL